MPMRFQVMLKKTDEGIRGLVSQLTRLLVTGRN
jgi:hypothetical protein